MYKLMVVFILLCYPIIVPPNVSSESNYLGEKECFACHRPKKELYLNNKHGKIFSSAPGTDLEAKGCEACHGPGITHKEAVDKEDKDLKIESFKKSTSTPAEKNKRCLACHENGKRSQWQGNAHAMSGVSCVTCHKIHDAKSESMIPTMEVCFTCHKERRAQLQRSSHMPLRDGKVTCMDCHNPHGGNGPSSLKASSVNETCYSCHQERRGPMLWEHAPVRESCTTCHEPHGSNFESLLKVKVPYLCQSCHDVQFHPSTLYSANQIPGGSAAAAKQLLGKGCINCHSQIHGSNHPSGARLQR